MSQHCVRYEDHKEKYMSQYSWGSCSREGDSRKPAFVVQSDKCYHRKKECAFGGTQQEDIRGRWVAVTFWKKGWPAQWGRVSRGWSRIKSGRTVPAESRNSRHGRPVVARRCLSKSWRASLAAASGWAESWYGSGRLSSGQSEANITKAGASVIKTVCLKASGWGWNLLQGEITKYKIHSSI